MRETTRSYIDWHYGGPPVSIEATIRDNIRREESQWNNMAREEAIAYKAKIDKSQVPEEEGADEVEERSYLLL